MGLPRDRLHAVPLVGEDGHPAIQKLADYAKSSRPVRWARVYQIPTYVFFSHRAHLEAKNTCQECHGAGRGARPVFREAESPWAAA